MTLREPIAAMALDYGSGDVAVTSSAGHLLVYRARFLGGDTKGVEGPVAVDPNSPVAFKAYGERMMLLVAKAKKLWILDAKSLQPFDSHGAFASLIELPLFHARNPSDELGIISTSRVATDPLIYVGTTGRPSGCFVDLAADGAPLLQGAVSHSAMISASGRLMNLGGQIHLRFPDTPAPPEIPGGTGALLDPLDQVALSAGKLVEIGTGKELGAYDGRAVCGLLKHPFFVTVARNALMFVTRDAGKTVATIPLPANFSDEGAPPRSFGSGSLSGGSLVSVWDDGKSDRLVVGQHDSLWLVPVPALDLPDLPMLSARVALPVTIRSGAPMSVAVRLFDKRVKASLMEGPEGAVLQDGQLTWTPDPAEVGIREFTLRYEAAGRSSEHHLHLVVDGVGIPVGFPVTDAALSEDGRYVAAWTNGPVRRAMPPKLAPRICVVDLKERRVLAARRFPNSISCVGVSSDQIFVRSGERTLDVLRLADLATVRTVGLTAAAARVDVFQNRLLSIRGSRLAMVQLPGLEPVDPLVGSLTGQAPTFFPTADGWIVGPAVMDAELKSIQYFHGLGSMRILSGLVPNVGETPAGLEQPSAQWHTVSERRSSQDEPLIVHIGGSLYGTPWYHREEARPQQQFPPVTCFLRLAHSANGPPNLANPLTQYELIPLHWRPSGFTPSPQLITAGGTVVVIDDGQLLPFVPTREMSAEPLRIRPVQPELTRPFDKIGGVRFEVRGGVPPYQVDCAVDPMSGKGERYVSRGTTPGSFQLDVPGLVQTYVTRSFAGPNSYQERGGKGETSEELIDRYTTRANQVLQPWLGRNVTGWPVYGHCEATVTDSTGQTATVWYQWITELPRDMILPHIEKSRPKEQPAESLSTPRNSEILKFCANVPATPVLPAFWPEKEAVLAVSNAIRKTYPRQPLPDVSVARLARQFSIDNYQLASNRTETPPERVWALKNGMSITGQLASVTPGYLQVRTQRKGLMVELSELTDESLEQAWRDAAQMRADVNHSAEISKALNLFYGNYGCFPPQYLIDDSGRPLLSWRVLILPELGFLPLFKLFHLDEPWDSPHNLELMSHVPYVYSDPSLPYPPHKTGALAVVGPRTVISPTTAKRSDEISDGIGGTILAVMVAPESAVEWTKPVDLPFTGDAAPLLKQLWRRQKDRRSTGPIRAPETFLELIGTNIKPVSGEPTAEQLREAIQIDDGKLSPFGFH